MKLFEVIWIIWTVTLITETSGYEKYCDERLPESEVYFLPQLFTCYNITLPDMYNESFWSGRVFCIEAYHGVILYLITIILVGTAFSLSPPYRKISNGSTYKQYITANVKRVTLNLGPGVTVAKGFVQMLQQLTKGLFHCKYTGKMFPFFKLNKKRS